MINPNNLREKQRIVAADNHRFRVLPTGRRFGKTFLSVYEMLRCAAATEQSIWYVAPTYKQAKRICWKMLKSAVNFLQWKKKFNETELSCYFPQSGSNILLLGANDPDSLRGTGINLIIMDEAEIIKKDIWSEVLRPSLSDTLGEALFIGTPKGRNWFYDLYMRGKEGLPDIKSWQYTTFEGGNVLEEEIEDAKRELDDLTFAQEYLASFVNFQGRVYYPFTFEKHCASLSYDPKQPLMFCFDFNVDPGVAAVMQDQKLPNGIQGTGVIGEVYIPRNSNTPAVCRKLIEDWGKHEGAVICYGDATGGARGSAKVQGSDWEIIRDELKPVFKERLSFRVKRANPPERTRVNAVNSMLMNVNGDIRLMVDPQRAPHVVKDFEGVQLLEGGSGEIDKKASPELTHLSDSIGYRIEYDFPIMGKMEKIEIAGI